MRTRMIFGWVAVAALSSLPCARAQVNPGSLRGLTGSVGGVTTDQASGGLKEALSRGISTSVASTGQPGRYFGNPVIKILMPERLKRMEQAMRAAGMGPQVDSFVKSMNAAAEEAAPAAKAILLDALKQMTFKDANAIVTGGHTAGTEYFKRTTTERIQEAFRPVIERSMAKAGVTQQFQTLMASAPRLPFVKTPDLDVNQYVLDKATDGLFVVMGQEETRIRSDPSAQVTPLLKTVFGGR